MKKVLILKKICKPTKTMIMNKISKILGIMLFGLFLSVSAIAQDDWGISDEQKAEKLKVAFDAMNQEAGEAAFTKNCKMCHMAPKIVEKNTRKLPLSPNLGAKDIQAKNTDGEIFHKISNGKAATGMPGFSMLSETERWQIVAYLRTFDENYEPPVGEVAAAPAAEKFTGTVKALKLTLDTASNTIQAKLSANDSAGNPVNAKNVKVNFYVQRTFGSLLLGTVKTNENSFAQVDFPMDLPADTNGYMTLSAAVDDSSAFAQIDVQYGEKLHYENPVDKPSMWGRRAVAPLWLKITYISVVLGVWLTIGWAAFQIFRIWMLRER
jgi:mono/diheme cytochrome c family protein